MDKKLYLIENKGCDDTTRGIAKLDENELQFLKNIIENLNKNSNYGCMPTIQVYEIDEKEIKEIDVEKIPKDCFEDGYVSKEDILFLENKTYTYSKEYGKWEMVKKLVIGEEE